MASSNDCSEATRVLLVDPHSLPVLLQGDPQRNAGGISVDLLQQALQGAAGIEDETAAGNESAQEVSLDALSISGVNNDNDNEVVAIYQGEGGQTHTIKISLAEAQSLGLQFTNDNYPESLSNGTIGELKGNHLSAEQGGTNGSISLSNAGLLQEVTCSSVAAEGRIIDTDGNIVETSEALQILPTSLSSYLEDGLNNSLSIVQQYELDGTVTYAVKLKDQNATVLGTDYHILEPDSPAKTGLDIEQEFKNGNLKQSILQASQTIPSDSIGLTSSVTLNSDSNSIQVPLSTLEALSKQILLPAPSSPVPISVTLSIPTETSVPSHTPIVSASDLSSTNANRFYQIVTNRNSGISNVISSDASNPLTTLVPRQTLTVNQQLTSSSAALLNIQNAATVALLSNNRNICNPSTRTDKLPTLLPAPKGMSNSSVKTITALKKQSVPTNIVSPTAAATTSAHTPAVASVAPVTTQPNLSSASSSKPSNSRVSSSNSAKPLGSSENPIQLVQQGQTFHSMQALSQAQLRQIATVLQQKHLNSNSTETKNVLFDEQTKTRIVYRVVYPEDVDLQQPSSPIERSGGVGSQSAKSSSRTKGSRGRPVRKRRTKQPGTDKNTTKSERGNAPLDSTLSPAADIVKESDLKDESTPVEEAPKVDKKTASGSRTRSGRVIRPPKRMMKDFKRLHYTDFKERDGNDSDGGYSDYSNPEQPVVKTPHQEVEVELTPVKKKISRFSCPTCLKLYLGLGRMEKHFQQHPDHGCFEEFKQQLFASTSIETTSPETSGEKEAKPSVSKASSAKGKKRSLSPSQLERERSEIRKRKLKLALQACDLSEIMEVAGPLIARYSSLWDLLLLRLIAKDEKKLDKDLNVENIQNDKNAQDEPENLGSLGEDNMGRREQDLSLRSTSNRVQWLLMELGSLADTLQSLARELFQPVMMHADGKDHIEISQKTVSGLLGVSCGVYSVNEEQLLKKMELVSSNFRQKTNSDISIPPEKRSRNFNEAVDLDLSLNHEGPEGGLSSLSLLVKPVDPDKALLSKLADEDMPFLNSSDDMICGSEDPDLSTDSKRDQDAGLQVVDDIVNERLKNLSDNMNFAVPLQSSLNEEQSGLHLITSFPGVENSISVSSSSVISHDLAENKPTVSVSNMDLISSYAIPSLSTSVSGAHRANAEPSSELTLEPVNSQNMLGSFEIGLSSLSTFDALQSQSSNVPHSEDSFLESLSSFETPLTQSCPSTSVPVPTFDGGVMKDNSMLQLESATTDPPRPPPKFISTFTPALTNDKTTSSISTAQRLQRSYLELDNGLDDGLDLDFEAFTQELGMNRNGSS